MAYLSAAELTLIRSAPSEIVGVFAHRRDEFALAAGLTGRPEALQVAAFCTVAAYDVVPYGGSRAAELRDLLAAPVLDCDNYCLLVAQLTEQFTLPACHFNFVGWDGGAVGNHAQLFVSSEGQSLLLDPTIALIVPNATLDAVATGVPFRQIASFYDMNRVGGIDIDEFNARVRAAIADGAYKIRDGVYNFTSIDGLADLSVDGVADLVSPQLGLVIDSVRVGWLGGDDFRWAGTAYGGKGNDSMFGSMDADVFYGGSDDDRLRTGNGNDQLFGETGNDFLYGGSHDDRLWGNEGDDWVWGESGHDVLRGGTGYDRLIGGFGRDVFDFDHIADAGKGATRDVIVDFVRGMDKVDVSTIDANMIASGDQAFHWIGTGHFGCAGDLRYRTSGFGAIIEGDINGDGRADLEIALKKVTGLLGSEFIL
jgi:hypothetical protein